VISPMISGDEELAPAKINLALHIRRRLDNGYHDIETLFAFVGVGDRLRFDNADGLSLSIGGPMAKDLNAGDDNLVVRAAYQLAEAAAMEPYGRLHLHKILPVASGIGGGSADAAAALRLLNRKWQLNWPMERLADIGTTLGADVPACVHSRPMFGTGRGDRLVPVDLREVAEMPVLLVNPGVAVPTGPVFAGWDGVDEGPLKSTITLSALGSARNDLQPGAIAIAPQIADVLECLSRLDGAVLVRMSGSGATCFALFEREDQAQSAQRLLSASQPQWWVCATRLAALS